MKRIFLALWLMIALALAALPAEAQAGNYHDGYTENGYVYHAGDGWWWLDGIPYTRESVQYTENVLYYGHYYPKQFSYWRYKAVPNYIPQYQQPALPAYTDSNWRSKFLDIAKQRDAFEGKLRLSLLEQQQYIQAAQELGFSGNFRWSNYGAYPNANNYSAGSSYNSGYTTHVGNYGVTGQTFYGYTNLQQLVEAYAQNPAELLQQSAALAKQSQENGAQATAQYNTIVSDTTSGATRMLEILAKGNAAANALNAANAAPSSTTVTATANAAQAQQTPNVVPAAQPLRAAGGIAGLDQVEVEWRRDAAQYCTICHSGGTLKGGFDVTKFWNLPPEAQGRIVKERLLAPLDDPKHMPQTVDGKGRKMPASAIAAFRNAAGKP